MTDALSRPRAQAILFGVLLAAGLAVRLVALGSHGTHDPVTFVGWGSDVVDQGLADAYEGLYFPVEWQLLGEGVRLSRLLDIPGYVGLKALTLLFDIGTFALLAGLLREWGLPMRYALLYWLSPYFLLVFWLGYVDAHLTFFVLAGLLVMARWPSPRGYLAAGIPLGLALMTKPQVIAPMGMLLMLIVAFWFLRPAERRQNAAAGLLLVGPAVLLVGYSVFFALSDNGLLTVFESYAPSKLEGASPGISGTMLNVWYPVALRLREEPMGISGVTEPEVLATIASVAVIALVALAVVFIASSRPRLRAEELFLGLVFTALIVPVIGPHAHENHLFLALTLSVVVAAAVRSRLFTAGLILLLAVQWLNIFAVYGLGMRDADEIPPTYRVPDWLRDGYTGHFLPQDAAALLSILLAAGIAVYAVRLTRTWRLQAADSAAPPTAAETAPTSSSLNSG